MNLSPTRLVALLLCAAVAGCASLPEDRGRSDTVALLESHGIETAGTADPAQADQLLAELDNAPLALNDAVHFALVNNPALRARFAELGFAAAEVYDAGRLSNPRLDLGYLFVDRGGHQNETLVGLTQNFTELILLPARKRLAGADLARAQHSVAGAVQQLANDVAHAYYGLAGATEVAAMQREIAGAAQTSADLALRFFAAGNIPPRELAEARAAAATAQLGALQAEDTVNQQRAALTRLLGIPTHDRDWQISPGLPVPDPADPRPDIVQLRGLADHDRLDLAAARQAVAIKADALGVARRFRYLGALDLGPQWQWDDTGMRKVGPVLSAELPIFNQGASRVARAEADLALREAELAALEIEIVTELDRTTAAVANAEAQFAQYRDGLIPARREIVARRQEDTNFMLAGPFELLNAKQDEYQAYRGSLEALTGYWLARVELARAAGQAPPDAPATAEQLTAAGPIDPGAEAVHHHPERAAKPDATAGQDQPADSAAPADHPTMQEMPGMDGSATRDSHGTTGLPDPSHDDAHHHHGGGR